MKKVLTNRVILNTFVMTLFIFLLEIIIRNFTGSKLFDFGTIRILLASFICGLGISFITHFFKKLPARIIHIVFVLAIDKEQLCNSICGFYGSDSINAAEYLRRFIDVEYYLPAPDYETFFDYIYNKLGLDDFFMKITRGNGYDTRSYQHALKSFPLKLLASKKLSLRQVEKFMLHMRLALQTIPVNYEPYPALIAFLTYLRQYERPLYSDIQSRSITIQQLVDKLESIIPEELFSPRDKYDTTTEHSTVYVVAQMLVAYASDYRGIEWTDLLKETNEGKKQLTFETHLPKDDLEEVIAHYSSRNYNVNLEYVVRHIELLCNLQNE